jgi:hypothetical protein
LTLVPLRPVVAAAAFLAAAAPAGAGAQPGGSPERIAPVVLLDVPYIPQSEALCGGAAAAMVMRFWGATGVYAESFEPLVDRSAGGIRGEDLLRALRSRGWDARSFRGDREAVRAHLAKRRPVVALIEDRPGRFHYVVIVAWPEGRVVLHDPARAPFRVLGDAAFARAWEGAGSWTMLALPTASARAAADDAGASPAPGTAGAPAPCSTIVAEGVARAAAGETDAARSLFQIAASACPRASGPWREIAGLDALAGAWRDAASNARRATALDSRDEHAWRILATALYVEGDKKAALDAWNRLGEPRVDLVTIDGLERTRFKVVSRLLDVEPQTVLTAPALGRAEKRLAALPAVRLARVTYEPGENGLARVNAVVIERSLFPTSAPAVGAAAVRVLADREVALAFASPTGGGELWHVSWRWWDRRPRVAAGITAPAPFGGTWGIDVYEERQAYAAPSGAIDERRSGAALHAGDWLTGSTRVSAGVGVDRWRDGQGTVARAGIEQHFRGDAVVLSFDAAKWFGAVDPWTIRARADWRSSTANQGSVLTAAAGFALSAANSPFALWHGAGTGQVADALLRAHPILRSGVVESAVFGRRVVHGGVEWRRWMQPRRKPLRIAPAIFVDAARATRGGVFSDGRLHVDVGAGLRVPLPGAGVLRVDLGRGLRDGKTALSIGWAR